MCEETGVTGAEYIMVLGTLWLLGVRYGYRVFVVYG